MGSPSSSSTGKPPDSETLHHDRALGGEPPKLRFVLLGEGLALAAAIERLRQKGHVIVGIVACSEAEGEAMVRMGVPVCVKPVDPAGFLAGLGFDVLLSIYNGYVLRAETLALARIASINYHNAPLPAYAGLRATAWAVFHGEISHGVTWHHIDPQIDTGLILAQRCFPLEPEETTASLNLRCTVAALESFEEVLNCIEEGRLEGRPQDLNGRSYFKRSDTVPGGGLIDWRWPRQRILRMIRACDWGTTVNDFGSAAFAVAGGPARFAWSAEPATGMASSPGTVLGCEGDTATVACGDGALRLTLSSTAGLSFGTVLPLLTEAEIEEAGSIHRRALLSEHRWLPTLRCKQAMHAESSPKGAPQESIACNGSREEFLLAVKKVLGGDTLIAVECEEPAYGLLQRWIPVKAGEGAGAGLPNSMPALLRDIAHRRPELNQVADWLSAVPVRIYRCGAMDLLPAGTIALGVDDRVHFRDAHALAHAVVGAMGSEMDGVATPSLPGKTVLTMVAAQAGIDPGAPAIEEDDTTTTRSDLQYRADRLARHLVAAGLKKEDGVGVLLPAGVHFVVGALASMRAGAAYVPLSPGSPARRLSVEMVEAGVKHIVTDNEHKDHLKDLAIPFSLIDEIALPEFATILLPQVFADDCAYRVFTSGSTGKPKAVEITHGALANLIEHYLSALPMQRSDRMTMLANPTFDASVADIWPILAAGGTLIVPPPRILLQLHDLIDWLGRTASTCAFVTTPIAERLLKMQWPRDIALHSLLTGGDVLHMRPPAGLPFRLINTYGPTENTVDSLWAVAEPGHGRPPIGRPIKGVTTLVVDENGQPVVPGQIGELVLGGQQVARGYRGQPALTAEKFVPDPSHAGRRAYRTGDRTRVNEGGEFEFHGRIDYQLQVLGQRVEPEEIEAVLKDDCRVEEAVCLPSYQGHEVTGLVVCAVLSKEVSSTVDMEDALHAMLAERLPPAMRPKTIEFCEDLPRTPGGKVDRRALTELRSVPEQSRAAAKFLSVPEIWKRLLPRAQGASGQETFWNLGGDSLAAINLLLEIEALTKVRVPIAHFLADPTLTGLIRLTSDRTSSTDRACSTVVQLRRGSGVPVVCWHTLSGDLETYQNLTKYLGERPIFGVVSPSVTHDADLAPSVEKMVADGLAALRRFGLIEPAAMVGYSWGGLLAFEAARQLTVAGMPPAYVGLIGTAPPITRRSRTTRLLHLLRWGPARAWTVFRNGRANPEENFSAALRRAARLLRAQGAVPDARLWKTRLEQMHVQLGFAYDPRPIVPVKLHLFRELALLHHVDHLGYIRYDKADFGWRPWAGVEPTVLWVDGHHDHIMASESVQQIAVLIERQLDALRPMAKAGD
jgi:amino acid adenylation domain-containing protein